MSPRGTDRPDRVTVDGHVLSLSHLDKVLYPVSGFTKGQVVDYYTRIAPVMLPHVVDRPLTMKRYPDGVDGPSFFEKHRPGHAPPWVRQVAVPQASGSGAVDYAVVCDLATLVWAANLAALELHVPLWHVGRRRSLPGPPDHMVFDLDPGEGTTVVECCRVAGWIRDDPGLDGLGTWPKTSGSKGLQVYVAKPSARASWDRVHTLAHDVAVRLEEAHPELVVSNMSRRLRTGKVLVDWSQNLPAKTTVAAYSLRGRPEPTVSTPVTWEEVSTCAEAGDPDLLRFAADDVLARVDELGDLFVPLPPAAG